MIGMNAFKEWLEISSKSLYFLVQGSEWSKLSLSLEAFTFNTDSGFFISSNVERCFSIRKRKSDHDFDKSYHDNGL